MILLTLGLFAFGIADLIRSPSDSGRKEELGSHVRDLSAIALGAGAAAALSALTGAGAPQVAAALLGGSIVLGMWFALGARFSKDRPVLPLGWITGVMIVLFSISSLGEPVQGPLERWYAGLDFVFVEEVEAGQFLLGCGAVLFAVASCNRIVVLLLGLVPSSLGEAESRLKGGRFLGPMERIIIGAVVLAGDPAAAAIVITAKGLLRFPEINRSAREPRSDPEEEQGRMSPDENTEYFLIGTIASLLLATILAAVLSASR
jgi:hypothetical protein